MGSRDAGGDRESRASPYVWVREAARALLPKHKWRKSANMAEAELCLLVLT